jgi:hypothetical protein
MGLAPAFVYVVQDAHIYKYLEMPGQSCLERVALSGWLDPGAGSGTSERTHGRVRRAHTRGCERVSPEGKTRRTRI